MKEVLLLAVVLGAFVGGYFLMGKLEQILDENRKAIEKESEKKEPTCIMLTEELSEEEIVEEVKSFRAKHRGIRIVLLDCSDKEMPEFKEYESDRGR